MNPPRTVAVTGASGLVGTAVVASFEQDGVRVLRVVRRTPRSPDEVAWDPTSGEVDSAALEGIDAVIHLAGRNLATEKWTPEVKKQIVDSRVVGTRVLSEALASLEKKPRVMMSASAIGFYGDRGDEVLDEESPPGSGFLSDTCQQWEAACQSAWDADIRVVQLRIGVVLSTKGGMLAKVLPQFRMGLGGVVGGGNQKFSWISLDDLVRAIRFVVDNDSMHGAVNGTAPHPVTNRQFTKALGAKLHRPTFLSVPGFIPRAIMGEMAEALVLEGADIRPKRLEEAGFQFQAPELPTALDQILG